jgi:hypothetical protein
LGNGITNPLCEIEQEGDVGKNRDSEEALRLITLLAKYIQLRRK